MVEISLSPLVSVNVIYALSSSAAFFSLFWTEPVEVSKSQLHVPSSPNPFFHP